MIGAQKIWLLAMATLANWTSVAIADQPIHARITAAAELRRRADPITGRTDFFGWESGTDGSWTPAYCWGSATTIGTAVGCCAGTDDCGVGTGCSGSSIAEISFGASTSTSRVVQCGGPGPLPFRCFTGLFFQNLGDTSALTSYYCGALLAAQTPHPTWYRTLAPNAAVQTTIPDTSYTLFSTPGVTNTKTSTSSSGSSTSGTTSASSPPLSNNSTTSAPQGSSPTNSSSADSGESNGLSKGDKIGIGIGIGLGVPILVLAALAWLCPSPLQRWRASKKGGLAAAQTPMVPESKPELPAEQHSMGFAPVSPWSPRQGTMPAGNFVSPSESTMVYSPVAAAPSELHGMSRVELHGASRTEMQ